MKLFLILFVLFSTGHCKVEFSERARNFSVELLFYTAEETNWHTVISPFGVWTLLTGLSLGATGSSRDQLITTLILPKKKENIIKGFKTLNSAVLAAGTESVELKNRNFVFIDTGLLIKPVFLKDIRIKFKTISSKFSFRPAKAAAETANEVIKRYGLAVSNVLNSDDFENSRMILTNVITFKGFWQSPFDASLTKVKPFYDDNNKQIGEVNMMNKEGSFSYSNFDEMEASIIEMPYGDDENSKYSFLAILPNEGVKVSTVYKKLTNVKLKDIILKLQDDTDMYGLSNVLINLPRFKISTNAILNRPLNNMGLTNIFDPATASLRNIIENSDIYVSSIVHKADIEVTETGTIASASTNADIADRMLASNFNANKPFIYLIMEKTTNTIIFSGVYSKPSIF